MRAAKASTNGVGVAAGPMDEDILAAADGRDGFGGGNRPGGPIEGSVAHGLNLNRDR
ncbi:MAG: hypothetical protein J6386_07170 [Candidatus Synoicihabitans palmerolidicus]|nr:hypothetical protein [Candidatus Synoicihabitans palmerolidicus]